MVGGLVVSQALTLFTTPVVYLYLDKLSNFLSGKGRGKGSHGQPPAIKQEPVSEAAE
jgi:HAE1 family hydrophobic/amphiphilic exporter-1